MPRFSDHLEKSAIRQVRQSTTVPNTSNTSAFTAEISDMFTPCFVFGLLPGSSFPDVQLHIVDAPPTSGLPEFGNIIVQVGNSRLGCAGPESILPVVVMDSGLARFTRALRRSNWSVGE